MGSGRTVAILDRLSQFVDARSRQRGETYFEADNVGQVTIDSVGTIVAEVYGRDMYDVWLAFDAGSRSLRVGCTCPHFDNGNVCKHVWAVLLSAADRDLLPDVAVNCVMLDHGDDENSLESHDADGDDDDEDWSDTPVYGPLTEHDRQFNNLVQGVGKPRGTRGWEQQLDVVSHTMTRGDGVSALDVSVQAQIINLMMDLQEEFNLSIIFIAHDLSVVKHISDRIGVMYNGELVEINNTDDIFDDPRDDYTKELLRAIPQPDPSGREERKRERLGIE